MRQHHDGASIAPCKEGTTVAEASHLQPDREYLLWWETHRNRWVAAPIVRVRDVLRDVDFPAAITVHPTPPIGTEVRRTDTG